MLARRLSLLVVLSLSSTAVADRAHVVPDRHGAIPTGAVCSHGENRCFAHVHLNAAGEIHALAVPNGFGPSDLWSAYAINPDITTTPTVAIVDAYGYANLESDLATYRAEFGLPACTRANGCLTVMSQRGSTSQLPPNPPADDDWTVETALDVDMVSAACPHCKILVVQGDDDNTTNLYTAQLTAAAAHPAVISDSWGRAEGVGEDFSQQEPVFDHPGIATFVSGGDSGFGDGGQGPLYPSTSAKVIAVGGTSLVPSNTTRGWSESAWVDGGSSCSLAIPKPSYQPPSPCNFRAATDISAVGDPQTGLAVFNSANGGFVVVGGTSAAAPIVASIFAGLGRGNVTAQEISQSGASLFDVTSGSNGTCGNILCNATVGWDGPTGFGTPNASALSGGGGGGETLTVAITSPSDGATVDQGFTVTATVTGSPTKVGLGIDGTLVATSTTPPYSFKAPANLSAGEHAIEVVAIDAANDQGGVEIHVTVTAAASGGGGNEGDPGDGTQMGGCSAGGGSSSLVGIVLGLAFVVRRRVRH